MNGILLDALVIVFGSKTAIAVIVSVAIGITLIATVINAWKSID